MKFESKTLTLKGRVVFQSLQVPSFDRLPKEYHENEACFIFVNQGRFQIRSQTEILQLTTETALLAKCLNYFYESVKKQDDKLDNVEVIGIMLYPELIKSLFDYDYQSSPHRFDFNLKQIQVHQLLGHYRDSIKTLLDHPELADEELIKNKLREFIILMTKTLNVPSELDFLAAMFKPNFAKFEEVIQNNLYANLNVEELARLCHMSVSTFKRKFTEVYASSPLKYFRQLKVTKAMDLLKNKERRISDIAYDLGFESPTAFNRVFKQQTGKRPSDFRLSGNE